MTDVYQDEHAEFSVEDAELIVRAAIVNVLNDQYWNTKKVNEWTNTIITNCLRDLQAQERPFKYIITAIIMQNTGAGLVTTVSTYWDAEKDNKLCVKWGNATMHCLVSIFGISVNINDHEDM